jgi:hypothetical protein
MIPEILPPKDRWSDIFYWELYRGITAIAAGVIAVLLVFDG